MHHQRRIVIDRLWVLSFKTRTCRLPFIEVHPLYRQHQTVIIDGRFESNPAQMTVNLPHPTVSVAIGESHLAAEGLMHRAIEIPDAPHGFARSNGREKNSAATPLDVPPVLRPGTLDEHGSEDNLAKEIAAIHFRQDNRSQSVEAALRTSPNTRRLPRHSRIAACPASVCLICPADSGG